MIVSSRGRYAVRIMLCLAMHDDYTALKSISESEGIPHKFAESMMTALVKAGLVEGSRGKNGGYRLARAPEEITAADILAVTETSLSAAACTKTEAEICPRADSCPTLPLWRELDDTVSGFLKNYSLARLLQEK